MVGDALVHAPRGEGFAQVIEFFDAPNLAIEGAVPNMTAPVQDYTGTRANPTFVSGSQEAPSPPEIVNLRRPTGNATSVAGVPTNTPIIDTMAAGFRSR